MTLADPSSGTLEEGSMHIMVRKQFAAAPRVLTTVAVLVVLGGCAMKGDVRDLQDEIRALAARQDSLLAELRVEAQSTQDTIRTQSDQMFDFRGDINQSIRDIAQSLARLEALAGENQRGIVGVRDQLANGRRIPVTPPQVTLTDPAGRTGGGSEQLLPGGAGNPDGVWEAAFTQYDRGSLSTATAAFQQFIDEYPNDERAARAHFNIADILEQQDRPEDALEAFQRIPQLYPVHEWVPNAMYRSAVIQHALGDSDAARSVLERIMNTYPDTFIATLARDELERIGQH